MPASAGTGGNIWAGTGASDTVWARHSAGVLLVDSGSGTSTQRYIHVIVEPPGAPAPPKPKLPSRRLTLRPQE